MVHQIINKDDLKKHIDTAGDKLVLVDFMATWCGPCKMIAPVLEKMASDMADKLIVVKIDVDDDDVQEICHQYEVKTMPTFLFFKKGEKVAQFSGANESKVKEVVAQYTA